MLTISLSIQRWRSPLTTIHQNKLIAVPVLLVVLSAPISAPSTGADPSVFESLPDAEALVELVGKLGLLETDLDTRALICLADHLPVTQANQGLRRIGWTGPFFRESRDPVPRLVDGQMLGESRSWSTESLETLPVVFRFAIDPSGEIRGALGNDSPVPGFFDAASTALGSFRYEPRSRPGATAVCHRQAFVPFSDRPREEGVAPILTPEIIESVTSIKSLLEILSTPEVLLSDLDSRSAICSLNPEVHPQGNLTWELVALGWPGPFFTGGDIHQVTKISRAQPQYNEDARKRRIQGVVVMQYAIGIDGRAHGIRILQPLDGGLDVEAIASVRKTQFESATLYGAPVSSCLTSTVNFRLQ